MDDLSLFTDSGAPVKLKITKQWFVVAIIKLPAFPKAGPDVNQLLSIPFMANKKPTDASVESWVAEIIKGASDSGFALVSYEAYQTSYAELAPVKQPAESPTTDPTLE